MDEGFRENSVYTHLGGNIIGGHSLTYSQKLFDYLIQEFHPKTILDLGCGEGLSSKYFLTKGIEVIAIDGLTENIEKIPDHPLITKIVFDLTKGYIQLNNPVDMIWCCELVEHVEKKYVQNILNIFKQCKILAMTHALPNQKGVHHVNCQPPLYWINHLLENKFSLIKATFNARNVITDEENFFKKTGLIFKNYE